jgi:hypothetical protein
MAPALRPRTGRLTTPDLKQRLPTSPVTPHIPGAKQTLSSASFPTLSEPTHLALLTLRATSPFRLPEQQLLSRKRSLLSDARRAAAVSLLLDLSDNLAEHNAVPALAVSYFDAFLSHCSPHSVRGVHIPLVAAACFLVAMKMLDPVIPTADQLSTRLSGYDYSPRTILDCELLVCVSLNFDFCLRVPHNVISHLCQLASGIENERASVLQQQPGHLFNKNPDNISRRMIFPLSDEVNACEHNIVRGGDHVLGGAESESMLSAPVENRKSSGNKNGLLVDPGEVLVDTALAFADLSLYCAHLLPTFGIGEITAACTMVAILVAQEELDGNSNVAKLWMPIYDLAGLNCFRVFAAIAHICDKLGDMLVVRTFSALYEFQTPSRISKNLPTDKRFMEHVSKQRAVLRDIHNSLKNRMCHWDRCLEGLMDDDKIQSLSEMVSMTLTTEANATTWLDIYPNLWDSNHFRLLDRLKFVLSEFLLQSYPKAMLDDIQNTRRTNSRHTMVLREKKMNTFAGERPLKSIAKCMPVRPGIYEKPSRCASLQDNATSTVSRMLTRRQTMDKAPLRSQRLGRLKARSSNSGIVSSAVSMR